MWRPDALWSGGGRSHEPRRFAFTEKTYGVARVMRAWEMARSSFYYQRVRRRTTAGFCITGGTKDRLERRGVLEKIREVINASPFYRRGPSAKCGAAAL